MLACGPGPGFMALILTLMVAWTVAGVLGIVNLILIACLNISRPLRRWHWAILFSLLAYAALLFGGELSERASLSRFGVFGIPVGALAQFGWLVALFLKTRAKAPPGIQKPSEPKPEQFSRRTVCCMRSRYQDGNATVSSVWLVPAGIFSGRLGSGFWRRS